MSDSEGETPKPIVNSRKRAWDPDDPNLPKHLRARYWTSWEDMKLVELWRRYFDEVITLKTNTPVFRKISEGMREYGFNVNGQECRRKISSLKNKYINERRRVETGTGYPKSEWRLYPLIHCLLAPKHKIIDKMHEKIIVKALVQHVLNAPKVLPPVIIAPPAPTVAPVISVPQIAAPAATPVDTTSTALAAEPSTTPAPTTPPAAPQKRSYVWRQQPIRPSHFSFKVRNHFTVGLAARLEQIRADNVQLARQRDEAKERMEMEELEVNAMEGLFNDWEQLLRHMT